MTRQNDFISSSSEFFLLCTYLNAIIVVYLFIQSTSPELTCEALNQSVSQIEVFGNGFIAASKVTANRVSLIIHTSYHIILCKYSRTCYNGHSI